MVPLKWKTDVAVRTVFSTIAILTLALLACCITGCSGSVTKGSVNDYSWTELSTISAEISKAEDESAAIEIAKRYNLTSSDGILDGTQAKEVTLTNGQEIQAVIVGFWHDDKTEGGKAGITFLFSDILFDGGMTSIDNNSGGWYGSDMRAQLNGDALELLPEELREVIVPVEKLTNNVGMPSGVESCEVAVSPTTDNLWLLSLVEICGQNEWYKDIERFNEDLSDEVINKALTDVLNREGSQYKLFSDLQIDAIAENSVLIKNLDGVQEAWWERSPDPEGYSGGFFDVSSFGMPSDFATGTTSLGVIPGFCI